jgi:Bardet-Biedl syndrome 2 protein
MSTKRSSNRFINTQCPFSQIDSLPSVQCQFEEQLHHLKQIMDNVDGHNATRLKLSAEIADASNLVKALVVKAEDYRLLGDMKNLRKVRRGKFNYQRRNNVKC